MMNSVKPGHYLLLLFLFFALNIIPGAHASSQKEPLWYDRDELEQPVVHFYFFWSEQCPHCLKALPDILSLENEFPWLMLHSLELSKNKNNVQTFIRMARMSGYEARSVPTFMFCGNVVSGYVSKATTGNKLKSHLLDCYQFVKVNDPDDDEQFIPDPEQSFSIDLPFLGNVSTEAYSLPVLTVAIAAMDAFNPCAFFVLLFLLSMMVHARSRAKMAVIGGTFVFISGTVYFLFMAAWLNVFIYVGELRLVTYLAGLIAIVIALINIKDYFWFKKGVSLTIAENSKPILFERMRILLRMDSMITVLLATIVLAIVANSYELLCTAGFPMVYTRILTLKSLPSGNYYFYLVLYNLVYILPLLVITMLFTIKLGSRKLSEHEGMVLKLLSGVMMLLLGMLLLVSPKLLNNMFIAAGILLMAVAGTWAIVKLNHNFNSNRVKK